MGMVGFRFGAGVWGRVAVYVDLGYSMFGVGMRVGVC